MKNLKISTRLALAFLTLTGLLLGIAAVSWVQIIAIREQTLIVSGKHLPSVVLLQKVNAAVIEFRMLEMQHTQTYDEDSIRSIESSMRETSASLETDSVAYLSIALDPTNRDQFQAFKEVWARYLELHKELIKLSKETSKDVARAMLGDPVTLAQYNDARKILVNLMQYSEVGVRDAVGASSEAYRTAGVSLLVAALAAVLLSFAASAWLMRSITGPLNRAVLSADRMAGGDFTDAISTNSFDEVGLLLVALGRMRDGVAGIASAVREGAESFASTSTQIARRNEELSIRIEQQNFALQQTTSTVEALGEAVHRNVEGAMTANILAKNASSVAANGGKVIDQVMQSVRGIRESAAKIEEITTVIDGIAFQTNLLALNAAVEAARAGEQGRGFAVVATEVRNLAHRSASAAREIKTLIADSVTRAENGALLGDQAGATMLDIVDAVDRVTAIVSEISDASTNQSHGLQMVGDAVTQMVNVTRQNSVLVEESAKSTGSLKVEAQQLLAAVETFKLA